MRRIVLINGFFVLLGAGCAGTLERTDIVMESLTLTTADGVSIAADYYPAEGDRYAILLHMMPATKESWRDFAAALQEQGIASIAIDQRGHGQSEGGPNGYAEFTDAEQASKAQDVQAAWEELHRRGANAEQTVAVGASIGSNLAIRALADIEGLPLAVALSPGLDYRSVRTEDVVKSIGEGQEVLIVASEEDEYSYLSSTKLGEAHMQATFWPQNGLGHGTSMFEADPKLLDEVVQWIVERL